MAVMGTIWIQLISSNVSNHCFITVESFSQVFHKYKQTNIYIHKEKSKNTLVLWCCCVIKSYLVLLACLERYTLPFAILSLDLFLQNLPASFIHKNNPRPLKTKMQFSGGVTYL